MAPTSNQNALPSRYRSTRPLFPPPELWLEIIPHIPYTPFALTRLRLVHPDLNALIQFYEHGLVTAIILRTTIPFHNSNISVRDLFPQMPLTTYRDLRSLHARLYILEAIERHITTTHPAFRAGLLLLYRLQDVTCSSSPSDLNSASAKRALLSSLSAASIACVLFALVSGVQSLREVGPMPLRVTKCEKVLGMGWDDERMQVELACEETLLLWGPELLFGLLGLGGERFRGRDWAVGYVCLLVCFPLCIFRLPLHGMTMTSGYLWFCDWPFR
ncbi:hypothetical protein M433DRAFT_157458 [Acidomyces richmondensis BFW]|nr:MAG: hypothetical protein FE78DRAFT_87827 [Acidomyces sp. 'richmondensis']KYG42804.1 hypothetical protein M433DRAFT_157458 [Acidomyces richmondensis BFW]